MTAEPLMTVRSVADRLALSESMVRTLARTGALPGFRIGTTWRFSRERIEAYIAALEGAPRSSQATHREPVMIASPLDVSASANGYVPVDFEAIRAKEAAR